jgi:hypothetical protein
MEMSTISKIQRGIVDIDPVRKKTFLLFCILAIVVCIYFLFEFGEFLLTFNLYAYPNPTTVLLEIFDDVILPFVFLGITVIGLLLTK